MYVDASGILTFTYNCNENVLGAVDICCDVAIIFGGCGIAFLDTAVVHTAICTVVSRVLEALNFEHDHWQRSA